MSTLKPILDIWIKAYENSNGDTVADDVKHIKNRQERKDNQHKNIKTRLDSLSHAFIRIGREASKEPVALFGQNIRSYAFNRIEVFEGQKENGEWTPGDMIFEGLMSEEALTNLLMRSNTSQSKGHITPLVIDGCVLDPFEHDGANPNDQVSEHVQEGLDRAKTQIEEVIQALQNSTSNTMTKEMKRNLDNAVNFISWSQDLHFDLGIFAEHMVQQRVTLLTEITNIVKNQSLVQAALENGHAHKALPAPETQSQSLMERLDDVRETNALIDAHLDGERPEERDAFTRMILWNIERLRNHLANSNNPEAQKGAAQFPKTLVEREQIRSFDFQTRNFPENEAHLWDRQGLSTSPADRMATLLNSMSNPHIEERMQRRHPHKMMIQSCRVDGRSSGIHTSGIGEPDGHYRLDFQSVDETSRFGKTDLYASNHLFDLNISCDDLMMAIRGHPDGRPVPCSIRHFGGVYVPPLNNQKSLSDKVMEAFVPADHQKASQQDIVDLVEDLKRWKDEGKLGAKRKAEILQRLENALNTLWPEHETHVHDQNESMMKDIQNDVRKTVLDEVKDVVATLPQNIVQQLRLKP